MINLIIIGAKNNDIKSYKSDDHYTWNNYNQADIKALERLDYDIITCVDICYEKNIKINNINYNKNIFNIGDIDLLSKDHHNIIIEFCNFFDENWCCSNYLPYEKLQNYNDYKITFLNCGCMWNNNFPLLELNNITKYDIYTPLNPFSINSYFELMLYLEQKYMKLYVKSIYQILGTLYWRGDKSNDYYTENVLYDLFNAIDILYIFEDNEDKEDFKLFLRKKMHWNHLNYNIRRKVTKYLYKTDFLDIS